MLQLVNLLLEYGAHIDQPNSTGMRPCDLITEMHHQTTTEIPVGNYITLKCLCATVIISNKIYYSNQIPKTLENFVRLHEP